MGPWLADTIRECDGLTEMMSYWTFSDVFEEQGVVKTPFYGGFGLIAAGNLPKPAYDAFQMLHRLGDQRIVLNSESSLLTRRADGSLVLAVWNYVPPEEAGASRNVTVRFKNTNPRLALIWRLDSAHGDFHALYEKMGEPRYPTAPQMQALRTAAALTPERHELKDSELTLSLPAQGLAVVELSTTASIPERAFESASDSEGGCRSDDSLDTSARRTPALLAGSGERGYAQGPKRADDSK
ncbi:MAG TPA: hypothetical protein VEI52_25505, partial [Terriglobales bacterium]|nr:hypothetical protein [Terriglobales bacterium]